MSDEDRARKRRKIDLVRDGAIEAVVGMPEEGGIIEMIPLGPFLIHVKEHAVYRFQLADHVDPDRTNIDVPHAQQRILALGANSPIVCRTLLTAHRLLSVGFLPKTLDKVKILSLYLDILELIASADDIATTLENDQSAAISANAGPPGRVLALPSVGQVADRCKSYIQKAAHTAEALFQVVVAFYGADALKNKGKHFDGIVGFLKEKLGDKDPRIEAMEGLVDFCKLWRNARHCVEHPKDDQRLIASDFALNAQGTVDPPMIAFVHAETPSRPEPMALVFRGVVNDMLVHAEGLIVTLCDIECKGGMGETPVAVDFIPEEMRRPPIGVQASYVILFKGEWRILG